MSSFVSRCLKQTLITYKKQMISMHQHCFYVRVSAISGSCETVCAGSVSGQLDTSVVECSMENVVNMVIVTQG